MGEPLVFLLFFFSPTTNYVKRERRGSLCDADNMKLKKHFEMHVPKPVEDDFEEEDDGANEEADQDDDSDDDDDDDSDSYENLDDVLGDQPDDDDSNEEYFEDYELTTR